MSAINITWSGYSSSAFSFQNAVFSCMDYGCAQISNLYGTGCNISNTQDCTAACQDPVSIFASPYTLHNCMILASLSPTKLNANGSLTLQNQTLSEASVETATNFSIHLTDPEFSRLADNVHKTISECLRQYCNLSDACYSGFTGCPLYTGDYEYPSTDYCYTNICDEKDAINLNPDVGGIGVCDPPLPRSVIDRLLNIHRSTSHTGCKAALPLAYSSY